MDQAFITAVCGIALAGVIFLSYMRQKRNGEQDSPSKPTIKETMHEISEYFGVNAQPSDSVSRAFDLAPLHMASSLTKQGNLSQTEKSKRERG